MGIEEPQKLHNASQGEVTVLIYITLRTFNVWKPLRGTQIGHDRVGWRAWKDQ